MMLVSGVCILDIAVLADKEVKFGSILDDTICLNNLHFQARSLIMSFQASSPCL